MMRPATPLDIGPIAAIQSDPANFDTVAADSAKALQAALDDPDAALLVWEHEGAFAGFALLVGLQDAAGTSELRRLAVRVPGKGIGAVFLKAIVDHVFDDLGRRRFWLDVANDNTRGCRAYERAGFTKEGVLRQAWLRRSGDYADLVLYGMLRSDPRPASG